MINDNTAFTGSVGLAIGILIVLGVSGGPMWDLPVERPQFWVVSGAIGVIASFVIHTVRVGVWYRADARKLKAAVDTVAELEQRKEPTDA